MASHENQLKIAINIPRDRMIQYCNIVDSRFLNKINEFKGDLEFNDIEEMWYEGRMYSKAEHYSITRYRMLNLHAFFTRYHTIEFRLFNFDEEENGQGGLNADQLEAWILMCLAMSQKAKESKRLKYQIQQDENPAYAFRCWLLNLGMIGKEFEKARAYWGRNFAGSKANRWA